MGRNKTLVVAAGAALIALAVYFLLQSLFESGEDVRLERTEIGLISEGPEGVQRKVRTEVFPTIPGDEGRAAQRDEEEKKAERQ